MSKNFWGAIASGQDEQSVRRGYSGQPYDPSKDDYAAHAEGQRARSSDDYERARERDEERQAERARQEAYGRQNGPRDDGGFLATLIFWPIVTVFAAAMLPARLSSERGDRGVKMIAALTGAVLYGVGVAALLIGAWVAPMFGLVGAWSGVGAGETTTLWVILAYFAVLMATPVWAWLLNAGVDVSRDGLPPGQLGPIARWWVRIVTLGGAAVLVWIVLTS